MSTAHAPDRARPRVAVLGDSISCGEGVGIRTHVALTWGAVLAYSLGADLELLATRGARTGDVRSDQLSVAIARPVEIATLIIGLNDISRGGWDAERMRTDLAATVDALQRSGATVLLGRLHDPTAFIPLPRRIRHRALERIALVNAAVDDLIRPGVLQLDLARVPELRNRASWAVDRVHPSIAGHRVIAEAGLDVLEAAGIAVPSRLTVRSSGRACSRLAEMTWLARHGAPYLVRNLDRVRQPTVDDRSRAAV